MTAATFTRTAAAMVGVIAVVVLFIWPGLVVAARNAAHRRLGCPQCRQMHESPPHPEG